MRTWKPVAALAAAGMALAMPALTGSAGAATAPCGRSCVSPFTRDFGPHYILDVLNGKARIGQPVVLFTASNHDGAEDFTYSFQGTVDDFYSLGLVSPAIELHYRNDPAFEIEFAPFGVNSNLCVGVASPARNGTPVSLQPCGATSMTIWIADVPRHGPRGPDNVGNSSRGGQFDPDDFFVPLINGSTTNFSHPFVLTYPGPGPAPWDRPRPQLITWNLTQFSDGSVYDSQLWFARFGVIHDH
jgi:hypothetical protein